MRALKRFPLLMAVALAFGAQPASAVLVGEPIFQPVLGKPLDIRIPVTLQAGEDIDDTCVTFARVRSEDGIPLLGSNARIKVLMEQGKRIIQVFTPKAYDEPFVRFIIQVNCGAQGRIQKEYTLLLDPPETIRPAVVESNVEPDRASRPLAPMPTVRPRPKLGDAWEVAQGDTLGKLARQVYPKSGKSRAQFIAATAKANNLPEGSRGRLPVGLVLRLPDHQTVMAEQLPIAEPTRQPTDVAPATAEKSPGKVPVEGDKDYKVKLATVNLDTKKGGEKDKLLRAEQKLMAQSDDQTAEILALRNQVRLLETRLSELNDRLGKPGGAPTSGSAPATATAGTPNPPTPNTSSVTATLPAAVSAEATPAPVPSSTVDQAPVATPATVAPAPAPVAQSAAKVEPDSKAADDNTMLYILLAVGAGVLGVFVLLFIYLRGGRQQNNYSFGDAGGERDTPPSPALPARTPAPQAGDIRPVLESAQQLLDRGEHDQALELVLEQIEKTRHEVKLWMFMFDVLKQLGRKADFQSQAIRFRNHFRGVKLWQKVQAVGSELDPHNPLYMAENSDPKASEAAGGFDISGSEIGNSQIQLKKQDPPFEDRTLKLSPGAALDQEFKSALLSKHEPSSEPPITLEPVVLPPDSYDNPDITLSDAPLETSVTANSGHSVEFYDISAPAQSSAPVTPPEPPVQIKEKPAAIPVAPVIQSPPASPVADETMVNLGIDLDAELGEKVEDEHEAATKLDLAKVYREMGANELAIDLLKEAVRIGTAKQREEANSMLAGLLPAQPE